MRTNQNTIGKYKAGEKVFAKSQPQAELTVRRYIDRIYYCKPPGDANQNELALFEREIVGN